MAMEGRSNNRRSCRVVLFPSPFQGHINPMFQLAYLLSNKGLSVIILHTQQFNAINPVNHPQLHFVPIQDGLSNGSVTFHNVMGLITALNKNIESPFRDQMAKLMSEESEEPVACLIVDSLLCSVPPVARELGLPVLVMRTSSAATFNVFLSMPLLSEKGYLPIQDSKLDVLVSESSPLRVRDLPYVTNDIQDFSTQIIEQIKASSGVIFNTFNAIEGPDLGKIQSKLSMPVFALGPLHKFSSNIASSLIDEDRNCVDWLDKQAVASVLYVSFGSLSSMTEGELMEAALGLANSQQPFIWALRPGSVDGSEQIQLPREFVEETKERGKVVKWAPQQEVLKHPAVGGFWTHNGWNSTMESICEGVPMLCQPLFGDQMSNARYVSHVWKVGIELEHGLGRYMIEKAIRRLMTESEGDEMRTRARDMKEKAAHSIVQDGSSHRSLDQLVDYILSFHNDGHSAM